MFVARGGNKKIFSSGRSGMGCTFESPSMSGKPGINQNESGKT
jgi:hypothetical protein